MAGRSFPRFKSRRTAGSFRVCETLALEAGFLKLPKLGLVRIGHTDTRQAQVRRLVRRGRARIVSVKLYRDACGDWWASLTIELDLSRTPAVQQPLTLDAWWGSTSG